MANRNFTSQRVFSFQGAPVMLQASCVIDSGELIGVRDLKGSGIRAISKVATGIFKVQLEDAYAKLLIGASGFVSGVSGNVAIASRVAGTVYTIRTVGTTTQAQWESVGVPAGVPAAVGLAFVAVGTGGSLGSGTLSVPAASGVSVVEVIGDPQLSVAAAADPHFFIQTLGATVEGTVSQATLTMDSYTPTGTNSAPALTMDSYTPAGTNDTSSPAIFTGTPAVLTGSVAAPVLTGDAAVLTGDISAQTFSGTASLAAVDPLDGSILGLQIMLRNSSIREKGE